MRAMKFRIENDKELSALVQEALFNLGYRWRSAGKAVQHTGCGYIYAESDGSLLNGTTEQTFLDAESRGIDIDWMRTESKVTITCEGKSVEISRESALALNLLEE